MTTNPEASKHPAGPNPAAVLRVVGEVAVENRPVLEPHQVVVAAEAVGICGSDVHYYEHARIGEFMPNNCHQCPETLTAESSGGCNT